MGLFLYKVDTFIIQPIVSLLFAIAFITFVWGVIEFIRGSDSPDGQKTGKKNIIWGIVGMVIMVSVYSIINIITGTIGAPISSDKGPLLPSDVVDVEIP